MELNPNPFEGAVSYGLEINCGDPLRAEVLFNDITYGDLEAGHGAMDSIPVHADLDRGENVAEVIIGLPGMRLNSAPQPIPGSPPPSAYAELRLEGDEVSIEGDEMTVTTHVFAIDEWDGSQEAGPVSLPHRLRVSFTPRPGSPTALWADGRAGQDNDVADPVYREIARHAELLRARDLDGSLSFTAERRAHQARCYPHGGDRATLLEREVDDLTRLFAAPDFAVRLRSQQETVFRSQARDRVFDWVDRDGEGALQLVAGGSTVSLPLQFSLLSQGIVLVR